VYIELLSFVSFDDIFSLSLSFFPSLILVSFLLHGVCEVKEAENAATLSLLRKEESEV